MIYFISLLWCLFSLSNLSSASLKSPFNSLSWFLKYSFSLINSLIFGSAVNHFSLSIWYSAILFFSIYLNAFYLDLNSCYIAIEHSLYIFSLRFFRFSLYCNSNCSHFAFQVYFSSNSWGLTSILVPQWHSQRLFLLPLPEHITIISI